MRSNCDCNDNSPPAAVTSRPSNSLIRVCAAYETGLSEGAAVKLQITSRTTASDVIHLVTDQLNRAALRKSGESSPALDQNDECDFCLVVVVGARERVLRDDFLPVKLQTPWTKGKMFVRLKSDLLAALEFGQVTTV